MKQNPIASYMTKLSILSIAVCFIAFFVILLMGKNIISHYMPYYTLFFYIITAIGYTTIYFCTKEKKVPFERIFLIVKAIKLMLYILLLIIVFALNIDRSIPFVIFYLSLYVIYLIFDTITLKKVSKQ
ncbi:MAG: hypothetical protein LBM25_00260 [Bacteroidales bacterium]|jgi:hypothetical protein|nr:hypothetical protein [Bacteroidales bacterium]